MVAPMAGLIDRGIALQPTSRDNEWNTTLGNLYYAASAFYRVAPDGAWVEWVIGARGDKDRALDYIQRAIAISPMRLDYHLEHGVVLTCIGVERGDAAALERGRRELAKMRTMPHHLGTDATTPTVVARRPLDTTAHSKHSPQSGSRARERSAHSSARVNAARRSSLAAIGSRSPLRQ